MILHLESCEDHNKPSVAWLLLLLPVGGTASARNIATPVLRPDCGMVSHEENILKTETSSVKK